MGRVNAYMSTTDLIDTLARSGWGVFDDPAFAGMRKTLNALCQVPQTKGTRKYWNNQGRITVTAWRLAKVIGQSERWTRVCLQRLEAFELIAWERGKIRGGKPTASVLVISKKFLVELICLAKTKLSEEMKAHALEFKTRLAKICKTKNLLAEYIHLSTKGISHKEERKRISNHKELSSCFPKGRKEIQTTRGQGRSVCVSDSVGVGKVLNSLGAIQEGCTPLAGSVAGLVGDVTGTGGGFKSIDDERAQNGGVSMAGHVSDVDGNSFSGDSGIRNGQGYLSRLGTVESTQKGQEDKKTTPPGSEDQGESQPADPGSLCLIGGHAQSIQGLESQTEEQTNEYGEELERGSEMVNRFPPFPPADITKLPATCPHGGYDPAQCGDCLDSTRDPIAMQNHRAALRNNPAYARERAYLARYKPKEPPAGLMRRAREQARAEGCASMMEQIRRANQIIKEWEAAQRQEELPL